VVDLNGLSGTDTEEIIVREGENIPPACKAAATPVAGVAPLEVLYIGRYGDIDGW